MRRRRDPYTGQRLDLVQARDLATLHDEIATTVDEHGIAGVPCLNADGDLWISEDRAEQHVAADRCLDCRAFTSCLEYRRQHIEHAVFAGVLPGRKAK